VHAKDFLVNDGGGGETVKAVSECLPQLDTETSLALVVETIDAIDRCTLVVAAENEKVLRVLNLVGEQQAYRFEGLLSSVNVVSKEDVV
jgi:hypothetical protein